METKVDTDAHQFLTFFLRGEEFGLGILQVKEILEYGTLTRVPMVPDFIKGVINLRGHVVPVIDLGAKFHMPAGEVTSRTCVVIVEVEMGGEQTTLGMMVDAVSEVMDISPEETEPPPPFGTRIQMDFIQGMAKLDKKFIILLNIDKVLSREEISVVERMQEDVQPSSSEREVDG